jgi:hypothetical protein
LLDEVTTDLDAVIRAAICLRFLKAQPTTILYATHIRRARGLGDAPAYSTAGSADVAPDDRRVSRA